MLHNPQNFHQRNSVNSVNNKKNLKRDINLIPANENTEKMGRIGAYAILAIIIVALLIVVAIVIPGLRLKDRQIKADSMEQQVKEKEAAGMQFDRDVRKRNALQNTIDILSGSGLKDTPPADLLAQISAACPDSITLTSFTLSSETGATIDGFAPNDAAIAQFIDNLKTIPNYQDVVLFNVQDNDKDDNFKKKRMFEIKAECPPAATASPKLLPAPTSTQQGGD